MGQGRCFVTRGRLFVIFLLASVVPAPISAGAVTTGPPARHPRVAVHAGIGYSTVTNPAPRQFKRVDAGLGWRLGLMVIPPDAERVALDFGACLDWRRLSTEEVWGSAGTASETMVRKSDFSMCFLTIPVRLRVGASRGGTRAYVAVGPETFVRLSATENGRDFGQWTDRMSWGAYVGVGAQSAALGKRAFCELGVSLGLQAIGGGSSMRPAIVSGLGDSKTRLVLLTVGSEL
jgi:hypothetical protein